MENGRTGSFARLLLVAYFSLCAGELLDQVKRAASG